MRLKRWFALVAASLILSPGSGVSEPTANALDPWIGTYEKYGGFSFDASSPFGNTSRITITKDAEAYRLTYPYSSFTFVEKEEGVLSDTAVNLGELYLGSAEFSDGRVWTILRVEFCYEHFFLVRVS